MKNAKKYYILLLLSVLSLQCLTPIETPPSASRTVRIRVQNSREEVLSSIPAALYIGTLLKTGDLPLDIQFTNKQGDASFVINIPATGASYTFLIGSDNTGKIRLPVKLFSRDTLLIAILDFKELPCNDVRNDTIRITDICAPLQGGQTFSDSGQISFNSGCISPLTISFTPLHDPFKLDLIVLDGTGQKVAGNSFDLPPKGSFTVKAVATPLTEGFISKIFSLSGVGKDGSQLRLNVTVIVNSISCSNTDCRDTTLSIAFKNIQVDTSAEGSIKKIDFLKNRSSVDRFDRIVVRPNKSDIFILLDSLQSVVKPNAVQSLRIRFTPKTDQIYLDTLVIESNMTGSTNKCYTIIQLNGQGCGPKCEPLLWGSVQQGISPDDFVVNIKLMQDEYSSNGYIYLRNVGDCGTFSLYLDTLNFYHNSGFSLSSPIIRIIGPGEYNYFQTPFTATDIAVWPNGHGQPAKINHQYTMRINGCGTEKRLQINVTVDTLPMNYVRCIYQWSDNGNFGYNFRPIETKGSDFADPNPSSSQISDLVISTIIPNTSADAFIKSGWKLIRENIPESEFDFNTVHSWKEYQAITLPNFNASHTATLNLRAVYALQIDRDGKIGYALIRLRDISVDSENKHKVCIDVMYPMIKNGQ